MPRETALLVFRALTPASPPQPELLERCRGRHVDERRRLVQLLRRRHVGGQQQRVVSSAACAHALTHELTCSAYPQSLERVERFLDRLALVLGRPLGLDVVAP